MVTYRFGACLLDTAARELRVDGSAVHLEPQVFDVLAYLLSHRDRLVPKSELLDAVWGSQFVTESALTSRIKTARGAIGDDGSAQLLIRNQRGRGYRFVGAVEVEERSGPRWSGIGRLPAARGAMIGRAEDLDYVRDLLARHRMVTICGPGGVGKTTLALEAARRRPYPDELDVAFVELAAVNGGNGDNNTSNGGNGRDNTENGNNGRDNTGNGGNGSHGLDGIVRAVAEAACVEGPAASGLGPLVAHLSGQALLLIVDNCEHLLDASAELVDRLLDSGAAVRILATSREPLGVDGEAVHRLGPLGPHAPALFAARAMAAAGHAFDPGDPLVVELCQRLDGLPLAIELAAGQTRHLSPADLISRLDDRLGILVGGRPRAGRRHATLAATIDWSYRLLSQPSRDLLDRLGVFPASFDLSAVQAISGTDRASAVNGLGDLVAKSLVSHDRGTSRYRLLETIRLFAGQRLTDSGLAAEVGERSRRHVVRRMTAHSRQQVWLSARLGAGNRDDIENVRAAFEASIASGRFGDAVDIAIGLTMLWRNSVWYAEGLRWVQTLAALDLAPRDRLWSRILAADIGLGSGDPGLISRAAAAALELSGEVDDPAAWVIVQIYRSISSLVTESSVDGLEVARERAKALGEAELHRVARSYRAVALLAMGRWAEARTELDGLTTPATETYDYNMAIWAAWMRALIDRDGRAMRDLTDRQAESLGGTGLRGNWVTMFCETLALIASGTEYLPQLALTRRRAEAEGRDADVDCVLALAYAAACRDEPLPAAELMGAIGGGLFHDTANFVHYMVIRDQVVRPALDPAAFEQATAQGRQRKLAEILSDHNL